MSGKMQIDTRIYYFLLKYVHSLKNAFLFHVVLKIKLRGFGTSYLSSYFEECFVKAAKSWEYIDENLLSVIAGNF